MKAIPIKINGIEFGSTKDAARYIVVEEEKLGNTRKFTTIAKELRRAYVKNGQHEWKMYGKWEVTL
jgi:hypothetical protein